MGEFIPEPDPANINAGDNQPDQFIEMGIDDLLASIEQEATELDVVADYAKDVLQKGLEGMALDTASGTQSFIEMYDQMWDRIAGTLLPENAEWRQRPSPDEQLEGLLGDIWSLKDSDTNKEVAALIFSLSIYDHRIDGVWKEIFGSTSYYGKTEISRTIESLCRDGVISSKSDPHHATLFIINLIGFTFANFIQTRGESMSDKERWLTMVMDQLRAM